MLNDWSHKSPGNINNIARAILMILPSLSQSAWNTRFYFGHQKPCMDDIKSEELFMKFFVVLSISVK